MRTIRSPRALRALLGGLLLASAPAVHAQAPARSPQEPLAPDPAVRTGRLENGLRYYVRANAEPQKRAELRLVVNAGSILEDEDQRGLAHVLEHMAFNGTRNFEKQELVNYLERVGMRFGPDINAYTSFDETVYMLQLPTDSAGVLEKGFDILEDWATGVTLDSVEVEKERGVVMEEWRLGQGADMRMLNQQFPVLFKGSRYADRLPIGTRASLESFKPSAVRRFYRDWYRPDLMAVVAVGDFDPARIEALIRQHFSGMPRAASPRERPAVAVPGHDEPLVTVATDPEASYTQVQVLYKHPLRPVGTLADYRRMMVQRLYDAMFGERLQELAQKPNPPFIGAGSGMGSFVRGSDVYSLGAAVSDTGVVRGLDALLTEAERVERHGFTATELERQKAEQLRGMERAFAEREKTPSRSFAGEYVQNFLTGEPFPGIAAEYEMYRQLLPGIRLEEVNALARELLTEKNRVILVSAPRKEGVRVPDETALLAVFDAVGRRPVAAYEDAVSDAPLVESAPRPGTLVSERQIPEVGVTEWRLSNGVRVLLKPTDFKADEILFTAYSPGGTSLLSESDYPAASLASSIVSLGGVGPLSLVDLGKRLAGKQVQVSPFISSLEEGVRGSASPRDLETMLQLVHLYFTAPRQDSAAFQSFRERARASLQNRGAEPEAHFGDTLQITLLQNHPRARPIDEATVQAFDLGRSYHFYRDRFADAGDFTFVFVGNFQPEQLKPMVLTWLGGLPSAGRRESWRDVGMRYPKGVIRKQVRRGVEPKSITQLVFTGPVEYTPENLYALRSLSQYLGIRLREQLREAMSGTYSPQFNCGASRIPTPDYRCSLYFGSAPERVEELTRMAFAEIDSLKTHGARADELQRVQELQRRGRETDLRQNNFWLGQIASFDQHGWELRNILAEGDRAQRLDARTLQEAARRYLDPANYVQVTLLPESGAPAK